MPLRKTNARLTPAPGAQGPRLARPDSPLSRRRRSWRPVERLWTKLRDLFDADGRPGAAVVVVLAPRRLERRRMLDAGAASLALTTLNDSLSLSAVQAGDDVAAVPVDSASAAPAPQAHAANDAAAVSSLPAPENLQIDPMAAVNEDGVATLQMTFGENALGARTVEVDWGDGSTPELFSVETGAGLFSTTHQYLDDDPSDSTTDDYHVSVRVFQDEELIAEGGVLATVDNVAPVLHLQPIAAIDEHGVATLELTFEDPGTLDTHTITVDWRDGSPVETFNLTAGDRFFSTTHRYLDDDPTGTPFDFYTVAVAIADDDGGLDAQTVTVRVDNVAPVLHLQPIAAIDEHGVATLELTFEDPGTLDTHTITVDWRDGSPVETFNLTAGDRFFSTTHRYLDDDPTGTPFDFYTVAVAIADDDGGLDAQTVTVRVDNVAPVLHLQPIAAIDEHGVATLELTFEDPGTLDTHTITVDWRDGSPVETFNLTAGDRFFSTTHRYLDDDPTGTPFDFYTVAVAIADDDGGLDAQTVTVRVDNVAPVLHLQPIAAIDEHGVATLELTFEDPGTLDTHTITVDWRDGSPVETFNLTAGDRFFSTTHRYLDDDPTGTPFDFYTVAVAIADDDGGLDAQTVTVRVDNVAPVLHLQPIAAIDEHGVATLELTFEDPGTLDTHTITVDWRDGSPVETFNLTAGDRFFSTTHRYLDDDPTGTPFDFYTVAVAIADDDGGLDAQTVTVRVDNVAPVLHLQPIAAIDEHGVATLELTFEDPGTLDTHTITVDWRDGSPVETFNLTAGDRFFSTTHRYLDDDPTGTPFDFYAVAVAIADDDGGLDAQTVTVRVDNVAPGNVVVAPVAAINEGEVTSFELVFEDVGSLDTHTITVDWRDGSPVEIFNLTAGDRFFSTTHRYLDNDAEVDENGMPRPVYDNLYHILVTITDDDTGSVEATVVAQVFNVNPELAPISATDVLVGKTTLDLDFSDVGADTFEVYVDWGTGSFGATPERLYAGPTPQHFTIVHDYMGISPNPANPADDILIRVQVRDDDFGRNVLADGASNIETTLIKNPGINTIPSGFVNSVAIQAPPLGFPRRIDTEAIAFAPRTIGDAARGADLRGAGGESLIGDERKFELRVVEPDDRTERDPRTLPDDVLNDLPGLFRKLPDNHYRIYLVQAETDIRLVIDVVVRNGRMIDPGDDSEGARDRPPGEKATKEPEAADPNDPLFDEPEALNHPGPGPGNSAATGSVDESPAGHAASSARLLNAVPRATDVLPPRAAVGAAPTGELEFPRERPTLIETGRTPATLRHGWALAGGALALAAAPMSRSQIDDALAQLTGSPGGRFRALGRRRRRRPR